ncbi:hypothetical protein [Roseovarius sp. SYSU LYC5161]|uniref:hypothetical protein n=1 Tax=Roseovarius halophilus (ex Wu et al. 2025) TaxID=3376060 RepID=UPI00399A0D14
MVSTSKILTVSYGTFSCTLEGFDDSFETMKAIAEYFRDLAADDRYFGAEPPTPDAEMLARIAEREISRHVQAREERGKIVLRADEAQEAAEAPPAAADVATAPAEPAEEAAPATPETTADAASPPTREQAAAIQAEAPLADKVSGAPQEPPEETVAPAEPAEAAEEPAPDTMAEVAPPEASTRPSAEAETSEAPREAPAPEEQPAEMVDEAEPAEAAEPPQEDQPAEHAEAAQIAPSPAEAADEEPIEIADEETEKPRGGAGDAVAEPAQAAEDTSIAARLRRIRSVVSMSSSAFTTDEYSEDEHAQDFGVAPTEPDMAEESDTTGTGDFSDISAILEGSASQADHTPPKPDRDRQPAETAGEESPAQEDVELARDTLAELLADSMPEPEPAPVSEPDAEHIPTGKSPTREQAPEAEPKDETATPEDATAARVFKVTRSEFETAFEATETEVDEGTELNLFDESTKDFDTGETTLSPEEEAELQRELAEVTAELAGPGKDAETTADQAEQREDDTDTGRTPEAPEAEPATTPPEAESRGDAGQAPVRGADKLARADDSDLSRIFEEADHQREQPESNQRRRAIQHLRAAVAATRAEERGTEGLTQGVDDTPFRSDLASAVRPRRPRAGDTGRDQRPEGSRAAPLKLVAEQRVDTPRQPVRPRRVSKPTETQPSAGGDAGGRGFSEFAEDVGATQLPDLLEAAAAYMADVEGFPQFSRPMLMGKLKEVEKEGFSREDGLRSFGQLLRQGKLQKIRGGRFAVTEETDFRTEARRAG